MRRIAYAKRRRTLALLQGSIRSSWSRCRCASDTAPGVLLQGHRGAGGEWYYDGRVSIDRRNTRMFPRIDDVTHWRFHGITARRCASPPLATASTERRQHHRVRSVGDPEVSKWATVNQRPTTALDIQPVFLEVNTQLYADLPRSLITRYRTVIDTGGTRTGCTDFLEVERLGSIQDVQD